MQTEALTRNELRFSSSCMQKQVSADGFFVNGFASMSAVDRDAHSIDPSLFDIDTFKKNPQLWVNHTLWNDGKGNGISVGSVVEIEPVAVSLSADSRVAELRKLADGSLYRADVDIDEFMLKDGEKGLWVVCKIDEPDVIKLVESKRLNAFSWSGVAHRRKNGAMKAIDLWEISLVNVPANQKSVFRMGKSLEITDVNGAHVVVDLHAVSALLDAPIDRELKGLSPEEVQQLAQQAAIVDTTAVPTGGNKPTEKTKGGDDIMDEAKFDEAITKLTKAVTDSQAQVAEQVTALTAKIEEFEKSAPAAVTPKPEDSKAAETPAAAAPEAPAATAITGAEEAINALQKAVEASAAATAAQLTALDSRIAKMEKAPRPQNAATDEDAVTEAEQIAKTANAVREALRGMDPAERKRIERNALANVLVPNSVGTR